MVAAANQDDVVSRAELVSRAEAAERERDLMTFAAEMNFQKWQEVAKALEAAQGDTLGALAATYPVDRDEVRALVVGFGELAKNDFDLGHVVEAMCTRYPSWADVIQEAFKVDSDAA